MLGGRCGSPAISGDPVALARPRRPSCWSRSPRRRARSTRRTASICSTIASPSPDQRFLGDDRVVGRVGRVEPRRQLGPEGADHVGAQQLPLPVGREAEGEISLPRLRMSTGRQGSNSQPQQLHLERQRPGGRGGGVDPVAEALEQGEQIGVELAHLALGRAPDARASASADRPEPLRPGESPRPARRRRGGRSPSARAGPGRGRSPARTRGRARLPASTWGTPQRSRRTRTGPSSPSSSILPLVFGSGRRASRCQSAAVAAATERGAQRPGENARPSRLPCWRSSPQSIQSTGQLARELVPPPASFCRWASITIAAAGTQLGRDVVPDLGEQGRRGSARRDRARRAGGARASRGARRTRRAWRRDR